jgi:hypothetical protein
MTIVGTAPVPGNGYLSRLSTVELPKIRTGQPELTGPCQLDGPGLEHDMCAIGDHANCLGRRAPQGCACDCHAGAADLSESGQSAATPCPPWCVEHTTGGANPGDRSTFHEARRTEVHTRSSIGDPVGGRVVPLPVWPPNVCPSWCSHATDPASHAPGPGGPEHPEDRTHIHDHYGCVPSADPNSDAVEPGMVELTLMPPTRYPSSRATAYQYLAAEMALHYREIEAQIRVKYSGGAGPVDLTIDEAARLACLLTHLVELAREG